MHIAASAGDEQMIKLLVRSVRVAAAFRFEMTSLQASLKANVAFCDTGPLVHSKCETINPLIHCAANGRTPLHAAAAAGPLAPAQLNPSSTKLPAAFPD